LNGALETISFLDDAGTGDVVLSVQSDTINGLFRASACGLFEAMVSTKEIKPQYKTEIALSADTLNLLLFQWLSELIYLKDAEQRFLSDFQVAIKQTSAFQLTATVRGEAIDPERHSLRNDVKAVTFHQFEVK